MDKFTSKLNALKFYLETMDAQYHLISKNSGINEQSGCDEEFERYIASGKKLIRMIENELKRKYEK